MKSQSFCFIKKVAFSQNRMHFLICRIEYKEDRFMMHQNNAQKKKKLIVDDSEINRSILADILGVEYGIIEATDGVEATEMLQKHTAEISAVLLDIMMPRKNGLEVLTEMGQRGGLTRSR